MSFLALRGAWEETHLKKPLQPSQVIALKWKPVARSPHTPQIRGTFRSKSPGSGREVLAAIASIPVRMVVRPQAGQSQSQGQLASFCIATLLESSAKPGGSLGPKTEHAFFGALTVWLSRPS